MALADWPTIEDDDGTGQTGTPLDEVLFQAIRDSIEGSIFSATNPSVFPSEIIDEVIEARGGEADLDTRLDSIESDIAGGPTVVEMGNHGGGQKNLVVNGSFETWVGASPGAFALGWDAVSGTIARTGPGESDTTQLGGGRWAIEVTGPTAVVSQDLIPTRHMADYAGAKDLWLAVVALVKSSVASDASIVIDDGVGTTRAGATGNGSFHSGGGGVEVVYGLHKISPSATKLSLSLQVAGSGSAYFSGVGAFITGTANLEPKTPILRWDRWISDNIFHKHSDTQNSGTSETTLAVYNLLPGLADLGPETNSFSDPIELEFRAGGIFAANGNTKTLRFYLGSTLLGTVVTTANAKHWLVESWIYRLTQGDHRSMVRISIDGVAAYVNWTVGTEDFDTALDIKLTGQSGTATGDVELKTCTLRKV